MTRTIENLTAISLRAEEVIADYRLVCRSRQVSLVGRREVMSGKAKFGIFGDGKEVVQAAMAHVFRSGDFRSGYYRDQTLMFAIGELTIQQFFAQLYAHADPSADPATAGRAMNAHFATRALDEAGNWVDLMARRNSSADISPTASQMPRLVGLAYASRLYREIDALKSFVQFSKNGNEIAFGTIGNASSAEGLFWESVNAIGVLRGPAVISIYDDGYGISVINEKQVLKGDLSKLLVGFRRESNKQKGYDLYTVKGWDYSGLVETYTKAAAIARQEHQPALIHVIELTQPQGHSTSGSHERYKSKARLVWEQEFDAMRKLRGWIIEQEIASPKEIDQMEEEERGLVEEARREAWEAYLNPIRQERRDLAAIIDQIALGSLQSESLDQVKSRLLGLPAPLRRDLMAAAEETLIITSQEATPTRQILRDWKRAQERINAERYGSHLHTGTALQVPEIKPYYSDNAASVHGFEVLNACFDAAMQRDPRILAFGEDVGNLGDVNQGMRGLQAKYGELRVTDTGIREATILGQAIGLAQRGLRPIAEIQYLDYLLYALQLMADDLATLLWRTRGGQKAPVIVRTRGHRLEGIWHSGSLMSSIINLVRGMYVLVPRNMTQAAGFYNTLFQADEPALVVEVLNAYRLKERLPGNIGKFSLPLGIPEILRPGTDMTLVTYGACCRIVMEAANQLRRVGVEAEVIDVQSLLPFDRPEVIAQSIQKTNRVIFIDEDVPGGATAYMLQQALEVQRGYTWLDSPPVTITGKAHRPAYGSDGDYFSKPSIEEVFEATYRVMNEADPDRYPDIF